MNIWIIDHYSVPPKYYPLARNTNFAKELGKRGHIVTIFCASSVHNSEINLIDSDELYREDVVDGVHYVYVKCKSYSGNGVKRILNMEEFAGKLPKVCRHFEKPDSVLSCSMTLQACKQGIKLAKKYGAKAVAQVTDLWPETLIAYGKCGKNHPAVFYLRGIEKWIYRKCDELVFSMEGAYDYIIEQKWEKQVPHNKVHFINNGVDVEAFDYNCANYLIDDKDLIDTSTVKVVYTGSIRQVNNLGPLLDAANKIKNPRIKFLIWGDGDEKAALEKRVLEEKIENVVFKGRVDKKYIPYIVSAADINIAHNFSSPIFRFGISFNKIFDYMAAGKPIFCDFKCSYNPVVMSGSGIDIEADSVDAVAGALDSFAESAGSQFANNARKAAENRYNFKVLTNELEKILK